MKAHRTLVLGILALSTACLEPVQLDEETFPCRAAEDCLEGFICHAERFICVPAGAAVDAGTLDAGSSDAN